MTSIDRQHVTCMHFPSSRRHTRILDIKTLLFDRIFFYLRQLGNPFGNPGAAVLEPDVDDGKGTKGSVWVAEAIPGLE